MKIFTRWPAPINKMAILRKNNMTLPFSLKTTKKIDLVVKYRKITVSNPEDISFS